MKRLLPTHTLAKKLKKLEDFLEDIGLEIGHDGMGFILTDKDFGIPCQLRDAADNSEISELPNPFVKMLVFENE